MRAKIVADTRDVNTQSVDLPVSDAIVSAMQMQYWPPGHFCICSRVRCPGLCKNRPAVMYMTAVHVCARVSERACTEPTVLHGADTTAYENASGRTHLHYATAFDRTRLHMQIRPADIIAHAIMSPEWYCTEYIIACDTGHVCVSVDLRNLSI